MCDPYSLCAGRMIWPAGGTAARSPLGDRPPAARLPSSLAHLRAKAPLARRLDPATRTAWLTWHPLRRAGGAAGSGVFTRRRRIARARAPPAGVTSSPRLRHVSLFRLCFRAWTSTPCLRMTVSSRHRSHTRAFLRWRTNSPSYSARQSGSPLHPPHILANSFWRLTASAGTSTLLTMRSSRSALTMTVLPLSRKAALSPSQACTAAASGAAAFAAATPVGRGRGGGGGGVAVAASPSQHPLSA